MNSSTTDETSEPRGDMGIDCEEWRIGDAVILSDGPGSDPLCINPNHKHDYEGGIAERPPCHCAGHSHNNTKDALHNWHRNKGPWPLLQARHGLPRGSSSYSWVDHPYRLRLSDGRWQYVAEPYFTTRGYAEADISYLRQHGFEVRVSEEEARHAPGGTVAIIITDPKPPQPRGHAAFRQAKQAGYLICSEDSIARNEYWEYCEEKRWPRIVASPTGRGTHSVHLDMLPTGGKSNPASLKLSRSQQEQILQAWQETPCPPRGRPEEVSSRWGGNYLGSSGCDGQVYSAHVEEFLQRLAVIVVIAPEGAS